MQQKHARLGAMLCALLVVALTASSSAAALAYAPIPETGYRSIQQAPVGVIVTKEYAYAAFAGTDSYDIMLADGSGKERRVARIKVDSVFFSDVSARLSADGSKIAFRVSGDRAGGSALYILDVKSGKSEQVASTKSTAESIGAYVWSPAGNTLAFVRSSPAPYPADVDSAYGSTYIYVAGQGTIRLGGSHGNEHVAGFSSDGKGVYVSRREAFLNTTLEHLVYLPVTGGDGVALIKSQLGLRYSHFAVWSEPGSPAKVAALAEGNFALALAPALPASSTPNAPTSTPTTILPPTEAAPADTATAEATYTPELPQGDVTPVDTPGANDTPTPGETPASSPKLATALAEAPTTSPVEPSATETVAPQPTPMSPSAARVSITGRLSGPGGLGIVVSDPAGTMPTLLRRDAEAYSYVEWTRDGRGILVGGTGSGAAWGVGLDGNRHAVGIPLRGLHSAGWVDASTVVLSDIPATRITMVDFQSGAIISTRSVGVNPQPAKAALRFGVPYIHQVNDTAGNANGNWACGPTSIAMALAYYGKLDPWRTYVAEEQAEIWQSTGIPTANPNALTGADFAPYITNQYSAYGRTYSSTASDPSGNQLAGLYGTICPTGYASWQAMVSVLESHGLGSQYVSVTWDGVVGALQRGHPVVLGNELTSAGHILLVIGYTPDGNLVVHDPYGNRFEPGYGGNNGQGILYPWKRVTPRRALEVIGTYPPPPRPPRPTRTPLPATETATPDMSTATSTPLPTETVTPMPGYSTPDLPPTVDPDSLLTTPVTDATVEPTYEPTIIPEETPTPTFNVSNLVLQVPLLLAAIGFALVRRRRE
ncbi:MAG TPA: C39 family peptidase [Chloroflexia bacterium]|nr:C39 family peptidase [Chloroflexia bacterium]